MVVNPTLKCFNLPVRSWIVVALKNTHHELVDLPPPSGQLEENNAEMSSVSSCWFQQVMYLVKYLHALLTKEKLRFQEWKVGTSSQIDEYTVYISIHQYTVYICIFILHTRFISFLCLSCPQLILGSCVPAWSALCQPLWHTPRGKALHTWHPASYAVKAHLPS